MSTAAEKLNRMTKDERSLLLYLESRAVDSHGIVDTARMNTVDMNIAKRWASEGFIGFARILAKHLKREPRPEARALTHVVQLLPLAFECAGIERMRRAVRNIAPEVIHSLERHGFAAAAMSEEMVPSV